MAAAIPALGAAPGVHAGRPIAPDVARVVPLEPLEDFGAAPVGGWRCQVSLRAVAIKLLRPDAAAGALELCVSGLAHQQAVGGVLAGQQVAAHIAGRMQANGVAPL